MNENKRMRTIVTGLLKSVHGVAVENGGCCPGTPDVNWSGGWIECKATEHWPAREDTPVRLDHPITKTQRIWIMKRAAKGGIVHVLLTVERDWLLFRGMEAVQLFGEATKAELFRHAVKTWKGTPPKAELICCLLEN